MKNDLINSYDIAQKNKVLILEMRFYWTLLLGYNFKMKLEKILKIYCGLDRSDARALAHFKLFSLIFFYFQLLILIF